MEAIYQRLQRLFNQWIFKHTVEWVSVNIQAVSHNSKHSLNFWYGETQRTWKFTHFYRFSQPRPNGYPKHFQLQQMYHILFTICGPIFKIWQTLKLEHVDGNFIFRNSITWDAEDYSNIWIKQSACTKYIICTSLMM